MKQDNTKVIILKKALELFSVNGYDAVSVSEIARAVGIKPPSLYSHYPSKHAIFEAIINDVSEKYEHYTNQIDIHMHESKRDVNLFTGINEETLIKKVYQIFAFSLHDETISGFRKMLTIEQFRSAQLSDLYTDRYVDRLVLYHAEIFDELIKNGEIKQEDPKSLAMMYVAPIITLISVCDRQPEREKECVKKLKDHVRLFYRTFRKSTD